MGGRLTTTDLVIFNEGGFCYLFGIDFLAPRQLLWRLGDARKDYVKVDAGQKRLGLYWAERSVTDVLLSALARISFLVVDLV